MLNEHTLLVADSYNGMIRALDLDTRTVRDWEEGFACLDDPCRPANQPAGISVERSGQVLLVDSNNHRILRYDPHAQSYEAWAI